MRRNLIFSIIWFLICLVLVLLLRDPSMTTHIILVLSTVFSYFLCVQSWVNSGSRIISIYSFFLAYSFICNCAQPLLFIFNVPVEFLNTYQLLTLAEVSYSMRFHLLCIAALNVGTCIGVSKKSLCVTNGELVESYSNQSSSVTKMEKYIWWILIALLLGTLYSAYDMARIRSSMSYHDYMYEGFNDVETKFYFQYFFCFLSTRSVLRKQHVVFIYICWAFFVYLYMSLGLRAQAIPYISMFIITLPITHSNLFKRKLVPLWAIGAFLFIILMGFISATRYEEKVDFSTIDKSQGLAASFYWSMSDMGSPGKTLGNTMKMCDTKVARHQSILYSVLTVIPHRVLKLPIQGDQAVTSPGAYLAGQAGETGYGFSYLAEAYYNFGWFGWLFTLIYGIIITRMENSAYKSISRGYSFFKITFLLWLSKQVFFARGDFCLGEAYIQYMVFTAIIFKLLYPKKRILA